MIKRNDGNNKTCSQKRKYKKNRIRNKGRFVKGSFTVEASFIVPMLLFLIAGSINLGYRLFQEAKAVCEIREELKELNPVSIVRNVTFIEGQIS